MAISGKKIKRLYDDLIIVSNTISRSEKNN